MWGLFAVAVVVQAAFLFVPGYLLVRAFGAKPVISIAIAPAISTALYFIWSEICVKIGVFCSWVTVALPVTAIALCSYFIGRRLRKTGNPFVIPDGLFRRRAWLLLALFLIVGVLVGGYVLVDPFDSPTDFVQTFDNKSHLRNLRVFTESGNWSSFVSAFYPNSWSLLGAMTESVLNTDYALIENALDFALACLVLPASMMAFLAVLTRGSLKTMMYGAFLTVAFVGFPWGILCYGPLMPNVAAYCMFPAMAVLFMEWVSALRLKSGRGARIVLLILACAGCASLHPNSIFLAIVFFAPYCLQLLYGMRNGSGGRTRALLKCAIFLIGVCAVWFALFKAPFMQNTVTYIWDPTDGIGKALRDILMFKMPDRAMQPVLGILIAVGGIWALFHRRYRWIVFSYAVLCLFYVIDACSEGFAKQLLTGFWYTDKYRIVGCMVLAAIPLAAMGISALDGWVRSLSVRFEFDRRAGKVLTCLAVLALVFTVYAPQRALTGGFRSSDFFAFDDIRFSFNVFASTDAVVYGDEERDFVRHVVDLVGDELVLNSPEDGSLFAPGTEGLNIYFTEVGTSVTEVTKQDPSEPHESWVIRARLSDIASDEEVREAVSKVGAKYLILLDQGTLEDQSRFISVHRTPMQFPGIDAVNDSTPGFTVILAEGDMRLYSIDAA